MAETTPIDEFCQGRLGLPELLTQIEHVFSLGGDSAQATLLDSWRRNKQTSQLDRQVTEVIEEKLATESSKFRLRPRSDDSTVVASSAIALRTGSILRGRFILQDVLGAGGMGVVFRAIDLRKKEAQHRDPYVAIKVLNEDFRGHPDAFRQLQREASKAQTLAHPNIITVYDFDREGTLIYLTMECLSGAALDKKMPANRSSRPLSEVLPIVKSVCAALSYAHENGIVHSDLKPANIFVTDSGRVKVIDFGIARALKRSDRPDRGESTVFDPGVLRALTPAYASIEMIEGADPDPRDDVYALGCITYELIAGYHPYGRMMAMEALKQRLAPKRPRSLTTDQWRALQGALSLDRERRTGSVDQFANDFLSTRKPRFATPLRAAGGAVLVIAGVAGAYWVAMNRFYATAPPDQSATWTESIAVGQQGNDPANQMGDRQTAEAARIEAERQAAEAVKREAERQVAEAVKRETERQVGEATARFEAERRAADAAKADAERRAAEAAREEAQQRQVAEAAKKEAERKSTEATRAQSKPQIAEATTKESDRKSSPDTPKDHPSKEQLATLNLPQLSDTALLGTWCAGPLRIRLSKAEWSFQSPDGAETRLAVSEYRVAGDKVLVYSTDNRDRSSVTEFGGFTGDQMTQIRGRLVGTETWNSYNRVFHKC